MPTVSEKLRAELEPELIEVFLRYTTPTSPDYMPEYARQVFAVRPEWFGVEQGRVLN